MQVPLNLIASPLNYTGGKYKLLPQILPLFPEQISTFVDIFCGGCNVTVNVKADNYICNDRESHLIGLLKKIKTDGCKKFSQAVDSVISQYGLSNSALHSYDFYNCNSSSGLGPYNKEIFMKLREDFNSSAKIDENYNYLFFTLLVYSFNNQIRFNSEGQYNLPVGKRDFNKKMRIKLDLFADSLNERKIKFSNKSFEKIDCKSLPENSFIYADPPYLITTATYNEKNGWTNEDENSLLGYLENLNSRRIKFALSNVLVSNGRENTILKDWINKTGFECHKINADYHNSNYHKKDKGFADEVLITNY